MASTIVPGNVLDGLDVSQSEIRGELTHAASDINALQGASYVTISTGSPLTSERVLTGTANEITITDGGAGSTVTLTISNNPVLPGTGSVTVPIGTVAQRPGSPVNGMLRYNSDASVLEAYIAGAWDTLSTATGGVTSLNGLTGVLSIAVGTAGTDFAVAAAGSTVTLNLPDAGAAARGVVTTGAQTLAGVKTFSSDLKVTSTGAVLVSSGTVAQRPGTPVNGMIRYNSDNSVLEAYVNSAWATLSTAGGVTSLNSLTGALSIAVGTAGTDFAVSASGSTVTLNLPDAGATERGVVTTGAQTLAGDKTFSGTTALGVTNIGGALGINNAVAYTYGSTVPTTGGSLTVNAIPYHLLRPAGTLATYTLSLVSAPTDGTVVSVMTSQQITSLTVNSAGADTVLNPPASLSANSGFKYLYNASTTTWYPVL